MSQRYEFVYVDVPDKCAVGQEIEGGWTNVKQFRNCTKEEVVAWIRLNIGQCDDDGNISLITLGTPL
jgi:hypothetical protein